METRLTKSNFQCLDFLLFFMFVSVFATKQFWNSSSVFWILNFVEKSKGKGLNAPFSLLSLRSFKISEILQVLFKSLPLTSYQSLQSTVAWISFKEIFEKVFFLFWLK